MFIKKLLDSYKYQINLADNQDCQTARLRPFELQFFNKETHKIDITVSSFTSEKRAFKTAIMYKSQLDKGNDPRKAYMLINFPGFKNI
jgi:hypothetical protein